MSETRENVNNNKIEAKENLFDVLSWPLDWG